MSILLTIAASLGKALLTEMFFKKITIILLKAAVKSTKNTLDYEVVAQLDKAWNKK